MEAGPHEGLYIPRSPIFKRATKKSKLISLAPYTILHSDAQRLQRECKGCQQFCCILRRCTYMLTACYSGPIPRPNSSPIKSGRYFVYREIKPFREHLVTLPESPVLMGCCDWADKRMVFVNIRRAPQKPLWPLIFSRVLFANHVVEGTRTRQMADRLIGRA